MKTLIDIQDELMDELLKESSAKTKKAAIVQAIKTFLDVRRRERLASVIGNFDYGQTLADLEEMRRDG